MVMLYNKFKIKLPLYPRNVIYQYNVLATKYNRLDKRAGIHPCLFISGRKKNCRIYVNRKNGTNPLQCTSKQ